MNIKRAVKIIKKGKRRVRAEPPSESIAEPTQWSTAVSLWVREFEKRRHTEPLPAFDRLFK